MIRSLVEQQELACTVSQEALLSALTSVSRLTPRLSASPQLCIEVQDDMLAVSYATVDTRLSVRVEARVTYSGSCTVPAKMLLDCVKRLPEGYPVTLQVKSSVLRLHAGTRLFLLKEIAQGASPLTLPESVAQTFSIESRMLHAGLKEVLFAAATESRHPALTALYLHVEEECMHLVAANPYRLACRTVELEEQQTGCDITALVPTAPLRLLASVLPKEGQVAVTLQEESIAFHTSGLDLTTRLLSDVFPIETVSACIPSIFSAQFTLSRMHLLHTLSALSPITSDDPILKLSYAEGRVFFHARSSSLGEARDEVEAETLGEGDIFFNVTRLFDLCRAVTARTFTFFLTDYRHPVRIVPDSRTDYCYVLMPMNVSRW